MSESIKEILPSIYQDVEAGRYSREELSYHELESGKLALTQEGREYLLSVDDREKLGHKIEQYVRVKKSGHDALEHAGIRRPIGSGTDAIVYETSADSRLAIKEIDLTSTPNEEFHSLQHMHKIAQTINTYGDSQVRVPAHYGLYVPHGGNSNYLLMEKVNGTRMFEVLNCTDSLPNRYKAHESQIVEQYTEMIDNVERFYAQQNRVFKKDMQDWAPHNIMVDLPEGHPRFWIIDQTTHQR